ncbi:MAG: helix-turn-helix domain-containing protein [Acidimicrobiia bacterium]|nr:helix-turn-helix domain-containing protein [Acidimicrobiia bacterium]
MTDLIDDDLPLVPPRRLGTLLRTRRQEESVSIDEIARRSGGRFLVSDLADIERGMRELDDVEAQEVAGAYGVDTGPIVPSRSILTIDLDAGSIEVGERRETLPADAAPDQILARYLALVQLLRSWEPGRPLPLRTADIDVLSSGLGLAPTTVEERLRRLIDSGSVRETSRLLRRKLVIPAAGLLVGTTAVGALVLVQVGSGTDTATATSAPLAVAAENAAGAAIRTGDLIATVATEAPAGSDPRTDIGDAAGVPQVSAGPDSAEPVAVEQADVVPDESAAAEPDGAAVVDAEPAVDIGEALSVPADADTGNALSVPAEADTGVELGAPLVAEPVPLLTAPDADPALVALGAEAEALISYPWREQLRGWTIDYQPKKVGLGGNTNVPTRTIIIYLDPARSAFETAGIIAHEVGHALDVTHFDSGSRQRWLDARGTPAAVWWPDGGPSDFHTGSGDFAEAVAAWMVDSPNDSTLAGDFTADQLALVAELLP